MKHKTLYLLCGPAGAGKSTWVRKQCAKSPKKNIHISRDEIRFSKISSQDEYFAHENEVFEDFIQKIQEAIDSKTFENIYVDATHLNEKSRNKVLDRLSLKKVDIVPVDFLIPVEICLRQNELRRKTPLAYVPRGVIRRMCVTYQSPTFNEKYNYKTIIKVYKENE